MSIVVGVDGSEGSMAALRWAIAEAGLRGTSVEAVYAWAFPYGVTGFGLAPALDQEALADARHAAENALAQYVSTVVGASDVEVRQEAVEGSPGRALVEKSRGADLLVVGSRGLGGFKELLLGSVSHQCALHAACPIVIVHGVPERE